MKRFLTTALAVLVGILMWKLISHFSPIKFVEISAKPDNNRFGLEVSYVDMVSLMLTGVTIVLAAFGFIVGVLGFLGWKSITAIADSSARAVVNEAIDDGGRLHKAVLAEARSIIRYSGVEAVDAEYEEYVNNGGDSDGA